MIYSGIGGLAGLSGIREAGTVAMEGFSCILGETAQEKITMRDNRQSQIGRYNFFIMVFLIRFSAFSGELFIFFLIFSSSFHAGAV